MSLLAKEKNESKENVSLVQQLQQKSQVSTILKKFETQQQQQNSKSYKFKSENTHLNSLKTRGEISTVGGGMEKSDCGTTALKSNLGSPSCLPTATNLSVNAVITTSKEQNAVIKDVKKGSLIFKSHFF